MLLTLVEAHTRLLESNATYREGHENLTDDPLLGSGLNATPLRSC